MKVPDTTSVNLDLLAPCMMIDPVVLTSPGGAPPTKDERALMLVVAMLEAVLSECRDQRSRRVGRDVHVGSGMVMVGFLARLWDRRLRLRLLHLYGG